jgi:Bacterial regulatory proteins, luxR family
MAGSHGSSLPAPGILTADATAPFQAMTQDRPHRPRLTPEAASAALVEDARLGRLDPECVRAVIEAAGQPAPKVRTGWPASLLDREVEVLRLVARGLSNRAIAERPYISPRTAEPPTRVTTETPLLGRTGCARYSVASHSSWSGRT